MYGPRKSEVSHLRGYPNMSPATGTQETSAIWQAHAEAPHWPWRVAANHRGFRTQGDGRSKSRGCHPYCPATEQPLCTRTQKRSAWGSLPSNGGWRERWTHGCQRLSMLDQSRHLKPSHKKLKRRSIQIRRAGDEFGLKDCSRKWALRDSRICVSKSFPYGSKESEFYLEQRFSL